MITSLLERIQLRDSQMEDVYRVGYRGRWRRASMPSLNMPLSHNDVFTDPEVTPKLIVLSFFLFFMEVS